MATNVIGVAERVFDCLAVLRAKTSAQDVLPGIIEKTLAGESPLKRLTQFFVALTFQSVRR